MILLKKLIFVPLFLVSLISLAYLLNPFLKSYDFVFSYSANTIINLVSISALIFTSSLLFVLLATIADDWRISIPVALIGSLVSFIFIDYSLAFVLSAGIFLSLLFANLNLNVALQSYLQFKPSHVLGPSIRHLSEVLILALCITYFFSASRIIAQAGFQIPDTLIDAAYGLYKSASPNIQQTETALTQLTPEQQDLLRKNPDLIRQSGLDPKMIENLLNPQKNTESPLNLVDTTIKQTLKEQVQNFIKPYTNLIPAGLSVLLFFSLQFFVSIMNILTSLLLWLIFQVLEKTGFVKFEITMREVKKLIV